jgi:hypothetical protein
MELQTPSLNSISYTRAQDFSSLVYDGVSWRNMFERPQVDVEFNYEMIWSLPFDKNFEPVNPFVDMFSPNGGSYLLQPAQQAYRLLEQPGADIYLCSRNGNSTRSIP